MYACLTHGIYHALQRYIIYIYGQKRKLLKTLQLEEKVMGSSISVRGIRELSISHGNTEVIYIYYTYIIPGEVHAWSPQMELCREIDTDEGAAT